VAKEGHEASLKRLVQEIAKATRRLGKSYDELVDELVYGMESIRDGKTTRLDAGGKPWGPRVSDAELAISYHFPQKLTSCILKVAHKKGDYNPYAVCRAAIRDSAVDKLLQED